MIWCASTETFTKQSAVHQSLDAFERGLKENDPIAPSMIYAYAALRKAFRSLMARPTLLDIPVMMSHANNANRRKDFKTGQTPMVILAPDSRRAARHERLVFNEYPGHQTEVLKILAHSRPSKNRSSCSTAFCSRTHPDLYGNIHQGSVLITTTARRQQRGLGQHRHFWLAGYPQIGDFCVAD
jgi:hypothetical protein